MMAAPGPTQWQQAFERALADSAYLRAQNEQWRERAEVAETEVERLRTALAECKKNLAIWEAPDQRW